MCGGLGRGDLVGTKESRVFERKSFLPGHGVPSWGCWGCVGGAVRGGTAESQVVPLRKKRDIRAGRAPKVGFTPGGITRYKIKNSRVKGGGVSGEYLDAAGRRGAS